MKRCKLYFIALLLFVSIPARADMFGAADVQIIAQLVKMYKNLEEQLKTVKKTYDVSSEIYMLSKTDSMSLNNVLNTELVDVIRDKGWMISGLDTLQSVSDLDRQISYMMQLLDNAKDAETSEQLQYSIDLLRQQRTILKLAQQTDKNIKKTTTDIDERESSRITAENTAVLARAALAAQDARNKAATGNKVAQSETRAAVKGFANIYQHNSNRGH